MPKKIIGKGNSYNVKKYHTVNVKDPTMAEFTGKVPHTVIKIGEDDKSEVGLVMSKGFKLPNEELKKAKEYLTLIDNKNWHLGLNQDIKPISLEKASFVSLGEDNDKKKLEPASKLSGTAIRLYPDSVLETPESKRYSDKTYKMIEEELREGFPDFKIKTVFDTKTKIYEETDIIMKPSGYYDPKNKITTDPKTIAIEITDIINQNQDDFDN